MYLLHVVVDQHLPELIPMLAFSPTLCLLPLDLQSCLTPVSADRTNNNYLELLIGLLDPPLPDGQSIQRLYTAELLRKFLSHEVADIIPPDREIPTATGEKSYLVSLLT